MYLYSIYLNYCNWKAVFEKANQTLELLCDKNIIFLGDFHYRIADKQILPPISVFEGVLLSSNRRSKDKKSNGRGNQFLELCDDHNLIILNGRSLGDTEGHFTYSDTRGASVINLCCAFYNIIPNIVDCQVLDQFYSNHFPIQVNISMGPIHKANIIIPSIKKLKWMPINSEKYSKKVKELLRKDEGRESETEEAVNSIILMIHEAVGSGATNSKVIKWEGNQVWFDKKCWELRKKLFKLLKLYRKTDSDY